MKPMGIILIALGVAALGCADSGDVTDPVGASGGDAEGEVTIDGPDGESTVSGSTGKESEGGGETSGFVEGEGVIGVQDCIGTLCSVEVDVCKEDDACAESYLCVLECDADAECVDACIELDVDSLAGPLGDLATCIAQNKCLTLDANEEGGSEEAEESEEGENEESSEDDEGGEAEGEEEGEEGGFTFPGEGGEEEAGGVTDVITCVFGNCGDEVNECFTDPQCSKVVECLTTCGSDTGCLQECGVSLDFSLLQGATGAVLTCAWNAGCIDLGGFGGGDGGGGFGGGDGGGGFGGGGDEGGEEEEEGGDDFGCGDGVCEWWEEFYCEEDCGGGDEGPGEDTCGDGFCDEGEQFFCPEDCTGGEGGEPADICGDGVCTSDEVGNCDADCEDANPSGPPSCGDGICEEWETGFCPEDCGGTDGAEAGEKGGEEGEKGGEEGVGLDCILDSCNTGMCMNFPECAAALECMGKCSDAICGEECLQYGPRVDLVP